MGALTRPGSGRIAFTYRDEAVVDFGLGTPLLSASLPIRDTRFPNAACKPFFEGLLPEGAVRHRVAAELRVSYANTFGLLEKIGVECAGAAVLVPEGTDPPRPDQAQVEWLAEDEVAARAASLDANPLGLEPGRVRLSLGGVQDKLVLVRSPDGRFGLPLFGAPSTHILKPNQDRYEDIVANEAYCMRVAACARLPVAHTEVMHLDDLDCLVIERFDRTIGVGNRVQRIHQEDFCQALGVLPESKYEAEGGPSVADVAAAIRRLSTRPAADVLVFFRAVIFNFLIGNSDAHGKNFALLYFQPGEGRLAPFYDLVSTAVYDVEQELAMSIGGATEPDEVSHASWIQFAHDCGLDDHAAIAELRSVAARVEHCAEAARDQSIAEGWHRAIIDSVLETCRGRAQAVMGE